MKKTYIQPCVSLMNVELSGMLLTLSKKKAPADESDALVNGYDDEYTDIWGNTYN